MIHAYIFDMDGVIFDSEPYHLESFNKTLRTYSAALRMEQFKQAYMGYQDGPICERMVQDLSLPITPQELLRQKKVEYTRMLQEESISPLQGVIEVIKRVHENGMPLAIASAAPAEEIEVVVEKFGIKPYFSVLISAREVPRSKPFPDVYLLASKRNNVPPQHCLVIEDTPVGVKAAKAAGMQCVGITTTHLKEELHEADSTIDSFQELLAALSQNG